MSLSHRKGPYDHLGRKRVDRRLFAGLLIGTVLIVGALDYFQALAPGPLVEQLLLRG